MKMSSTEGEESQNPGNPPPRTKRCVNDFIFGKQLGEGSFSIVYLAKDIHTSKEWAVKVCEKRQIIRERKQEYVKREREALNRLSGVPGFLKLFCTFQDPMKLYFVMTYARKGTLLQLIERVKKLDMESIKFYSAQILLAMQEMHARNIIHRDLKPENVLLDEEFHIMIADFGSSRIDDKKQDIPSLEEQDEDDSDSDDQPGRTRKKRGSFVGTAQYVSPEILRGKASTEASDLWSFGCILYQMVSGDLPFQGPNDYLIFQKINNLELEFPSDFDRDAEDLIRRILVLEPRNRLGAMDDSPYVSIRKHKFLEGVDFSTIRATSAPVSRDDSATGDEEQFPESAEPGLTDEGIARMLHRDWFKIGSPSTSSSSASK